MSAYDLLIGRGWRLSLDGWQKRGWCFGAASQARACEEWCETTYGAVPSRECATKREIAEIRRAVEAGAAKGRS
jgi:hypothetical protein